MAFLGAALIIAGAVGLKMSLFGLIDYSPSHRARLIAVLLSSGVGIVAGTILALGSFLQII